MICTSTGLYDLRNIKKSVNIFGTTRGIFFAERARLCLGHFRGAPGQNFWFSEENQKMLIFQDKKGRILMFLNEYFVTYTLKLAIYLKNYENIIVSRE